MQVGGRLRHASRQEATNVRCHRGAGCLLFCFAKSEGAEASAKRFGGERLATTGGRSVTLKTNVAALGGPHKISTQMHGPRRDGLINFAIESFSNDLRLREH
jgi:hypothetical protein